MMTAQQALDHIAQLRAVLGVGRSTVAILREAFDLEPLWAESLGMLYARNVVTRDGLYTVLYEGRPECEWPDEKILDVQLSKMRKHLRNTGHSELAEAIVTKWGEGWSLTPAGKAIVRDKLGDKCRAARLHVFTQEDCRRGGRSFWAKIPIPERSEIARRRAEIRWKKIQTRRSA